jgi:hypothetical protein
MRQSAAECLGLTYVELHPKIDVVVGPRYQTKVCDIIDVIYAPCDIGTIKWVGYSNQQMKNQTQVDGSLY